MEIFLPNKTIQSTKKLSRRYWLTYPATFQNSIGPLLHQQMWLFGRDILYPAGNLLYGYGFTHQHAAVRGSSMYRLPEGAGELVLWGWGIWYGEPERGAVFVNRLKPQARYTAVSHLPHTIHHQQELPRLNSQLNSLEQLHHLRHLFQHLLRWLAAYEAWIIGEHGRGWRQRALQPFKLACTPLAQVEEISLTWGQLAADAAILPTKIS